MQRGRFVKIFFKKIRIDNFPRVFIILAILLLLLPFSWLCALFISAIMHECGHLIALKAMNVPVDSIRISHNGIKISTIDLSTKQELIATASGPLTGLAISFLFPWIPKISLCACIHTLYNLCPIGSSDGARILKCCTKKSA